MAASAGAIAVGNTGESNKTPLFDRPAWVYREPARMKLTGADRKQLFETASQFIQTAVARKHLDSAWGMLGPEMRAGQTRKSWNTGFNNVIPFRRSASRPGTSSTRTRVMSRSTSAWSASKHSDWAGKTFTIELKRYKGHGNDWLVASWVPKGIGGAGRSSVDRRSRPAEAADGAKLDAKWLLLPVSIFGLLIATLVAWAIRGAVQQRRAARRYARGARLRSARARTRRRPRASSSGSSDGAMREQQPLARLSARKHLRASSAVMCPRGSSSGLAESVASQMKTSASRASSASASLGALSAEYASVVPLLARCASRTSSSS